ncbi:polyisoprenoid-binding protein YceI [Flavobacterium arsenatis]|uniref:Polyisoprenoid-binding protein YceI n=1 Tax=Flavobacterium arsenatis TaxID=1484332 RepID=A0ABU1TPC1_9FLAO|nr:YceI family protein [Flavobacterium arsenatis]MDR6967801.1 polyisoprenoid-binding protein YceI [Flavobacterium arsenatis]
MRNFKTIAIALLVAFGTTVATAQTKKVDVAKTKISWVGKKVTGAHEGTVSLKEGNLVFNGKKLTGGTFTVDMNSIQVTDLKADQGKEKLEGHLKADDFFGTEKFPTAKLNFTKVAAKQNGLYTVTADLTLKGITKPITFDITVNGNKATSALKIDRTKYDIKYGSGSFFDSLGDKAINDEFELAVELAF